jgi:hypothetical protein
MKNPDAPRVPIIQHADVRRNLLWMKSNVESMRALGYFIAYCFDMHHLAETDAEKEKWIGLAEVLTPICKAYCSDVGFRVTETAMQIYGGYGYCAEYPVEQFLRDEKIASIYEGANGVQALDLVGRKLGMKKGAYFMGLLGEMNAVIAKYKDVEGLKDLAEGVQSGANTLAEIAMFFAKCGKEGKFLVPVNNATPFLALMGRVVSAWFIFWQAGIAQQKLAAIASEKGIAINDAAGLAKTGKDAAYYVGKVNAARFFIRNVLPEIDGIVRAIKTEDMSILEIPEESFAS